MEQRIAQIGLVNLVIKSGISRAEALDIVEQCLAQFFEKFDCRIRQLEQQVGDGQLTREEIFVDKLIDECAPFDMVCNKIKERGGDANKLSKPAFLQACQPIVTQKSGLSIMVDSLKKDQLKRTGDLAAVDQFLCTQSPKNKFKVFLSAITKRKDRDDYTTEYQVACKLKEELKKRKIGVFWWDDEDIKSYGWNISTKIAMGLACSSIFVSLAFDSVSKQDNGDYVYDCLLEGDTAYKTPNFFKYEIDTYYKFLQSKTAARKFVKDIVDASKYDDVLPENRVLRYFTYGRPADYTSYPMFNDNEDRIHIVNEKATVDEICKSVLSEVVRLVEEITPTDWDIYESKVQRLFHVAKHSPSDYYLEYAVIDEKGNDAAKHFTFFLEKKYNSKGMPSMRLNMVVNDWNNAFCDYFDGQGGIKSTALLSKAYAQSTNSTEYQISADNELAYYQQFQINLFSNKAFLPLHEENDSTTTWGFYATQAGSFRGYTNNGGKAEVCFPAESVRAKVTFFESIDNVEREKRVFDVTLNVVKKEIIKYTTKLTRGKLKIDFSKPVPRKVDIEIVNSDSQIPCFSPVSGSRWRQTIEEGSHFIIISKVSAAASNEKHFRINVPTEQGEEKWERRYPFIVFQYEGETFTKKDLTKRMFTSGSERTCLYCAGAIRPIKGYTVESPSNKKLWRKALFKKGPISCDGKNDDKAVGRDGLSQRIICFNNKLLEGHDEYFVLPKKYENEYSTNAIIALIGASGAGKSTFISRFFNIGLNNAGEGDIIDSLNDVNTRTQNIVSTINEGQVASALQAVASIEENKNDTTANGDEAVVRSSFNRWRSYYAISPYFEFVRNTPKANTKNSDNLGEKTHHLPFIVSVKRNGAKNPSQIAFYDVPGVDLYKSDDSRGGFQAITNITNDFAHHHANGIILFINDGGVSINNDILAATAIMQGYIEQYKQIRNRKTISKDDPIKDVALAIVLCQFDRIEYAFDLNSTVRSTAPAFHSYSYASSELPEYIEKCSHEIESYLKSLNGFNSLAEQLAMFAHNKFFTVSSIGHSEAISIAPEGIKQVKFVSKPRNMEYIFAWLMFQTGIID